MGKLSRIAQLESQVEQLTQEAKLAGEAMDYIRDLANLPEDAVMIHNINNTTITHAIGKSARVLLEKLSK